MADRKMQDRKLEELSQEELQKKIEEDKKKVKSSLVLAFSAVIAIIALCIAWFVANNLVNGKSSTLAADSEVPFVLASTGVRQNTEKNYLKDADEKNLLSEGNASNSDEYKEYVDTATGETVSKEQVYYMGTSNLAWYLDGQESVQPGAGGKLEFYIIPRRDNLSSVTVNISLKGYVTASENSKRAVESTDEKLQKLLEGHVLLFRSFDDTYGYYGWLGKESNGKNESFIVDAPSTDQGKKGTFIKNMPYKVTIYWKWPQYFRNYVYTQRSTQGDLFTDRIDQGDDSEYKKFIEFLNSQKDIEDSKLFYDAESTEQSEISGEISNTMSDAVLNACSQYYNQADEYLGDTIQYVYIQADVN